MCCHCCCCCLVVAVTVSFVACHSCAECAVVTLLPSCVACVASVAKCNYYFCHACLLLMLHIFCQQQQQQQPLLNKLIASSFACSFLFLILKHEENLYFYSSFTHSWHHYTSELPHISTRFVQSLKYLYTSSQLYISVRTFVIV